MIAITHPVTPVARVIAVRVGGEIVHDYGWCRKVGEKLSSAVQLVVVY